MEQKEKIIEEKYLEETLARLNEIVKISGVETENIEKIFNIENEKYLNSLKDMDLNTLSEETAINVANMQVALEQKLQELEKMKLEVATYKNMINSPYFAKLDIVPADTKIKEQYYIGMHTLNDENNNFVVLDWRSPIASVFYDYQVGKAKIVSDNSTLDIELLNKRQFKIIDSKLKYFFDTNIAIEDELLQDALGQNSSNSMKSIVQTIQAEQNSIIRSPEGVNLVVNGVAGSGKTAIALHRIAYLLYKLKGKLDSDSVLVLSHNNAFSSYISQVLPELAEQDVRKVILDILCAKNLSNIAPIENKYEQIDRIINNSSQIDNWKAKTSFEFFEALNNYCYKIVANNFQSKSFMVMGVIIPKEKIDKLYFDVYSEQNLFTRICWISEALVEDYFYNVKSVGALKKLKIEIFEKLFSFVSCKKPIKLYLEFLETQGLDMKLRGKRIKNEDAYAIWFIKMFIFGYSVDSKVKHLIVDEMQEYSALQLKIIDMLYPCSKTMLGDTTQSIESLGAKHTLDNYSKIFKNSISNMVLTKSYRSTMQIAKFFAYLSGNRNIEYVHRSGDEIGLINVEKDSEISKIRQLINENSNFASIGIITKTNKEAKELFTRLKNEITDISLISNNKDLLENKVCIISAFNSKGLEFDYVIAYNTSKEVYKTEYDNNLLFIVASRAVHKLDLISINDFCDKINEYFDKIKKEN